MKRAKNVQSYRAGIMEEHQRRTIAAVLIACGRTEVEIREDDWLAADDWGELAITTTGESNGVIFQLRETRQPAT